MDDSVKGYSGDSSIDDSWTAESQGASKSIYAGPAGEDSSETRNARRLAATEKAKNGENNASKAGGALTGGLNTVKNAEKSAGSGFKNNVAGKTALRTDKLTFKFNGKAKNNLKKYGPFGAIFASISLIVFIFSASQSAAPFGLIANGLDQFNSIKTILATSTKHYGPSILGMKNTSSNKNNRKMTGHVAGWYDDSSEGLHRFRIFFSRNSYEKTNKDIDTDANIIDAAKSDGMDEGLGSVKESDAIGEQEQAKIKDVDENEITDLLSPDTDVDKSEMSNFLFPDSDVDPESGTLRQGATADQVSDNLSSRAKGAIASLDEGVGVYCGVVKAFSAISAAVSAMQIVTIINYVTKFLNAGQQAQAGDGGAALHYFMLGLSQMGITNAIADDGSIFAINGGAKTTALQSPAWNQFFSDGAVRVSADDPMAKKFNKDYSMSQSIRTALYNTTSSFAKEHNNDKANYDRLAHKFGKKYASEWVDELVNNPTEMYESCVRGQAASSGIVTAVDAVKAGLAIFTGGASLVVDQLSTTIFDFVYNTSLNVLIGGITEAITSFVIPKVVQWLAMDLITNMVGEDAAYAINSGFNAYLGKQMQQSSGLPGDEEKVLAQYRETQTILAEEAEYQRSIRSPFDMTSKYTFLGSIVNAVTPIATSLSTPLSVLSNTINLVGSSFNKLLPTAAAAGESNFETSLNYECPGLSDLGLVGDAFCNPYFVSDYSTLTSDNPYDSIEIARSYGKKQGKENFEDDSVAEVEDPKKTSIKLAETSIRGHNNPKIKDGSPLAKWTIACTQRETQYGIVDPNTMNALAMINTGNSTLDNILESGLSSVPYLGHALQLAEALDELVDLPFGTGEKCLDEESLAYSRYSEDQRWLEASGDITKSAVAAYLEDYYERFPVDKSYEGVIARYSGMTKSDVETTFAIMEYATYIANYDSTDTWPLGPAEKKEDYKYDSEDVVSNTFAYFTYDQKIEKYKSRQEYNIC